LPGPSGFVFVVLPVILTRILQERQTTKASRRRDASTCGGRGGPPGRPSRPRAGL